MSDFDRRRLQRELQRAGADCLVVDLRGSRLLWAPKVDGSIVYGCLGRSKEEAINYWNQRWHLNNDPAQPEFIRVRLVEEPK